MQCHRSSLLSPIHLVVLVLFNIISFSVTHVLHQTHLVSNMQIVSGGICCT
jgi:hypothetical protein